MLTLTSYFYNGQVDAPTTSPAQQAKWILTRFLGVSAPTPLPNIPRPGVSLPETHTVGEAQQNCACHALSGVSSEFLPAIVWAGEFRPPRPLALRLRS